MSVVQEGLCSVCCRVFSAKVPVLRHDGAASHVLGPSYVTYHPLRMPGEQLGLQVLFPFYIVLLFFSLSIPVLYEFCVDLWVCVCI